MAFVDVICLANSKKLGGWCVAGLSTDTGNWIRPVANTAHGQFYPSQTKLPDRSQPRVLDLLRIPLKEPSPLKTQPENWLVSGAAWDLLARPPPDAMLRTLDTALARGPELLGSTAGAVSEGYFETTAAGSSLALIAPTDIRWHVTRDVRGNRQLRVHFRFRTSKYDLAVTDIEYERKTRGLEVGTHPLTAAGVSLSGSNRIRFTISLSEPFHGCCYKLVAGVALF